MSEINLNLVRSIVISYIFQIKQTIDLNNLTLATILASNDSSSRTYIKIKTNMGKKLGINVVNYEVQDTDSLIKTINNLNSDINIHGILVQMPISNSITNSPSSILNLINPLKDCDCLTSTSLSRIFNNDFDILPAVVRAILFVLEHLKVELKGKVVTIVNNSNLIGLPLSLYLSKMQATVVVLNKYTKNIKNFTLQSDIVVLATGVGELFDSRYFSENTIVIDVTSIKKGARVVGDLIVDDNLRKKNIIYTPVPGGIGPLTVLSLFWNLVKMYQNNFTKNHDST